ncbi:hypothetical protein [Fonticella tunisiensis]|uniref:PD(D/E)XK endonuclease domain-containing protein n=1 Tax=Fonticella tunisiensis TaxID=1096341 RepID=A0A4R7KV77_9CLOT|nr:hypothetical protein [Fonticella tunisiensis]TDT63401.1 hypothetical protein EDD71_102163 [Fonticella tunisiensis]
MGYIQGIKWTEEKIEQEIRKVMAALHIYRMPSRSEIKSVLKDNALCNKISRTGGFKYWADRLGLDMKESDTKTGKRYEVEAANMLRARGYEVEQMSIKHPYDLLVNGKIKIDVKVGRPYMLRGESRVHTFRTEKRHATCDLYLIFALDEHEEIERIFIIPGYELKVVTMCIGRDSKYNKFIGRWDLIEQYDRFYKSLK